MQILRTARTGQFTAHSGTEAAVMRPSAIRATDVPFRAKEFRSWEVSSTHIKTIVNDVLTLELTGCYSHEVRRASDSPHH
jgi:hypothetical protein